MARHHVEIDIDQLNSADLWKQKDRLAEQEAYLRAAWHEFDTTARPDERESMMAVVRSTLIRLAETDHWIPGSVAISKGRIDMHISIDLTVADTLVHFGPSSLAAGAGRVKARLQELEQRLIDMDEGKEA